jgi:hypothetical protein
MIFYTLHELFNLLEINTDKNGKIDHGKRNCKLFLLGTFLWIILFVLAWNYKMGFFGPIKLWTESLIYGLFVMLFADLFVMAYIYRSYFGRNILWEVNEDTAEEIFDYDESKHKYKKKHRERWIEPESTEEEEKREEKINFDIINEKKVSQVSQITKIA